VVNVANGARALRPVPSTTYTERMYRYDDASCRLGSRRLGGPALFKDFWPALRYELYAAYVHPTALDALPVVPSPRAEEMGSSSFSLPGPSEGGPRAGPRGMAATSAPTLVAGPRWTSPVPRSLP
jgi:hypothetical protein